MFVVTAKPLSLMVMGRSTTKRKPGDLPFITNIELSGKRV